MKLRDLGEFAFIDRINFQMINRPEGVIQGVGDDAAVFEARQGWLQVLTTDMLVQGVHFLLNVIDPERLGRKSLAVNLSDVAAMGAEPLDAYISLAIPGDMEVAFLDALYKGIRDMAQAHGVNLLGGDTTRSSGPLVINVALTGMVPRDEVVFRSGARPKEPIYVTSWLGDAAGGLDLIQRDRVWDQAGKDALLKAHFDPKPQVREGRFLAENHLATAMIDLSDGVASDLAHLCERSGVGAIIYEDLLPVSETLKRYAGDFGLDVFELTLSSGEDYGLLFTTPKARSRDLERLYEQRFGMPIWRIGETTAKLGMVLVKRDGSHQAIEPEGWDHFKPSKI